MTAKDKNTFAAWQEANQIRREGIIDEYLVFLGKTRVKVKNTTDLAELVARHISQVEGKSCNKSTLLRNNRYKSKILYYLARTILPGSKSLKNRSASDPLSKSLLFNAQLETGNLRRELDRLNIYAASLESQLDMLQSRGYQPSNSVHVNRSVGQLGDCDIKFAQTCQALRKVISYFNFVIQIDRSNHRILDLSKRRDNIIVDKDVADPFFVWLALQGESK